MLEGQGFFSTSRPRNAQRVRVGDRGGPLDVLHFPVLDELPGAAGEPLDDVVLEGAQLVEIDARLAELDAPRLRVARFIHDLGDVQQGLGRNAPAVDADAARIHLRVDERHRQPEIGREERSRVPSRAAADDDELGVDHKRCRLKFTIHNCKL